MTKDSGLQVHSNRSKRSRIGLVVDGTNAMAATETIAAAEAAGVEQIWMGQPPTWPDTLTTLAAAATKTSTIGLGTSIVPTYPRHPLVLAQQVLSLFDIAPNRLRLGIGPSHQAIIEGIYGLPHTTPLAHPAGICEGGTRCAMGREGRSSWTVLQCNGDVAKYSSCPSVNFDIRKKGISIGRRNIRWTISWVCPVPYLLHTGIQTLRSAAVVASGRPVPPWWHMFQ